MKRYFFLLLFLIVGCAGDELVEPVSKATEIMCTAAYRSTISTAIEQELTMTFGDVDDTQTLVFADMALHGHYRTGEVNGERSLQLRVTDMGDTAVYQTALYQLPQSSGPQNQFVGGHGFTGLQYSYSPESTAELQFWCESNP